MEASLSCSACRAELFHCHEVSVVHADGTSSCADPWCTLPHHVHEWQLACAHPAAAACWCTAGEGVVAAFVGAGQVGGRRYTDTWLSIAS